MLNQSYAISIASLICVVFTVFNLLTLLVIILTRKLRLKVSNYPLMSFLLASALQGFVAAPLYIFKRIAFPSDVPMWLCDLSRFSYIYCGHVMSTSLMLVSFDRLVAVALPFRYHYLTVKRLLIALTSCWLAILAVDLLPFQHHSTVEESCSYVPDRAWGIGVIISFNTVPFVFIALNYTVTWRVAARLHLSDRSTASRLNGEGKRSKLALLLEMRATKRSLVLFGVYVMCWSPKGLFFIYDHFCNMCLSRRRNLEWWKVAIKILSHTSSVFAPICYVWWNQEYILAAKKLAFKKLAFKNSQETNERRSRTTTAISNCSSNVDERLLVEKQDQILVSLLKEKLALEKHERDRTIERNEPQDKLITSI